jgi:hypothetical protein
MSSLDKKVPTTNSSNSSTAQQTVTSNNSSYRLPSEQALKNASRLAIVEDKPVMFDYWTDSLEKKCLIGIRESSSEKLLVKNAEEYTSPISKIYSSDTDYIIVTENSIYIVSRDIPTKRITA